MDYSPTRLITQTKVLPLPQPDAEEEPSCVTAPWQQENNNKANLTTLVVFLMSHFSLQNSTMCHDSHALPLDEATVAVTTPSVYATSLFGNVNISSFFFFFILDLVSWQPNKPEVPPVPLFLPPATDSAIQQRNRRQTSNIAGLCAATNAHIVDACRPFAETHSHPVQCGAHCSCTTHTSWGSIEIVSQN